MRLDKRTTLRTLAATVLVSVLALVVASGIEISARTWTTQPRGCPDFAAARSALRSSMIPRRSGEPRKTSLRRLYSGRKFTLPILPLSLVMPAKA